MLNFRFLERGACGEESIKKRETKDRNLGRDVRSLRINTPDRDNEASLSRSRDIINKRARPVEENFDANRKEMNQTSDLSYPSPLPPPPRPAILVTTKRIA